MPRFCANLTWLFTELPFLERFGAARSAGFEAVEVLFPYDCPVPEVTQRLAVNGLTLALINAPPPNFTGGTPGFPAVPGDGERFRHDFRRALRYARALGAQMVHVMAGVAHGPAAHAAYVDNLRWAAATAGDQMLTIEPINAVDMPGYFLNDFDLALQVLDQVGAPNLRLQFDAYHARRITGDVQGTWARVGSHVAHVQVAGHPGRNEPDAGDIDHAALFARLDQDGYDGWVSGEYQPRGLTEAGLGWIRPA